MIQYRKEKRGNRIVRLKDFLEFDHIVIQCHDNPDADAIASGFALHWYFEKAGKEVRFVYSGNYRIQKSNLKLMIEVLDIPMEYVEEIHNPDLLITVDCQYGQGNVKKFEAKCVAVIDHHQISGKLPELSEVQSSMGACSTLVKELLEQEGLDINTDKRIATALYYGLMTDTGNFTEISNPRDKDLRDDADFERSYITRFRNANISIEELVIAGNALLGYEYDSRNRFAIVQAKPCDPNILGMIADIMLEVDVVDSSFIYSILPFGIKFSVRSCIKEVKASELAEFMAKGIGSGGGHIEKAGGFIQSELLERERGSEDIKEYLKGRMESYFKGVEIIEAKNYEFDATGMVRFKKKNIPCGYVLAKELFAIGTKITIRTLDGDIDLTVEPDTVIMLGTSGEVYPITKEKFENSYDRSPAPYEYPGAYVPVVRVMEEGKNVPLQNYARTCIPSGKVMVYTKVLDHRVKVFRTWDEDRYLLGEEGDVLAVREDDPKDVYIIRKHIFEKAYEKA